MIDFNHFETYYQQKYYYKWKSFTRKCCFAPYTHYTYYQNLNTLFYFLFPSTNNTNYRLLTFNSSHIKCSAPETYFKKFISLKWIFFIFIFVLDLKSYCNLNVAYNRIRFLFKRKIRAFNKNVKINLNLCVIVALEYCFFFQVFLIGFFLLMCLLVGALI